MSINNTGCSKEPTSKVGQIFAQLRSEITCGTYQPGQRFPTFDEMADRFGVSRAVLQQAVRRLRRDGFVRSVSRQGMYVSETPPHLTRHALIVPGDANRLGYSRMVEALLSAAENVSKTNPTRQYAVYECTKESDYGMPVHRKLAEDIRMHRLVGLVYAPGTRQMLETFTESETTGFPKVFLGESPRWGAKPTVGAETEMFYQRALKRLVKLGRRQVAIVHMAGTASDIDHGKLFTAAGVEYHEPWIQNVGRSHPECVQSLLRLLFDPRSTIRPDGLIIGDDNLVDHATAGLMRVGLRVGLDLDVIAYTHWPWREPCVLPIHRLGFDMGEMMQRSMEVIQDLHEGVAVPNHVLIPAVFEDELTHAARTAGAVDAAFGKA